MTNLTRCVRHVVARYRSLNECARALRIDKGYLHRLCAGVKSNPSPATLRKLGLTEVRYYTAKRNAALARAREQGVMP